ncbi:MAG: hypothetical protein HY291_20775 [Planctomycetes bacterium]|nr:hypothetical protein [Planctomycetota bacterium]
MRMRVLCGGMAALLAATLAGRVFAEGEERDPTNLNSEEGGMQFETAEHIKKARALREKLADTRKKEQDNVNAELQKLNAERAEKIDKMGSAETTTIDGQKVTVNEPKDSETALGLKKPVRDHYEISPEDFELYQYERWSLNAADFRFDKPGYVIDDIRSGHGKRWFVFSYSITNSTAKTQRIAPVFIAVTENGVFSPEAGGLVPQRYVSDSIQHPLADSTDVRDTKWSAEGVIPLESVSSMLTRQLKDGEFKLDPMQTFLAGQTRWGAAVWPEFNDQFTELKIVVHGLSNAHKFDRKQRRVLVLTFNRNDDEFNVERSNLVYKSKQWEYLWAWDQDISVPVPADPADPQIKDKAIKTPSGVERLLVSFPYTIDNSSGTDQTLTLKEIRFVLRGAKAGDKYAGFDISVGDQKINLDEVPLVDDGRSTIYKAQYLRDAGKAAPGPDTNRFAPAVETSKQPGGMVFKIENGKKLEGRLGVFDVSSDVDWRWVREQVEDRLTLAVDKKALADKFIKEHAGDAKLPEGGIPGYIPRRTLTDDTVTLASGHSYSGEVTRDDDAFVNVTTRDGAQLEFKKGEVKTVEKGEMAKVKEQILAAVPAALEALKKDKKVFAYFTCEAGLSTGQYRIARSYHQPGVIQDDWLKAWETLEQK